MAHQNPHALRGKPGKQPNVHARIDKVFRRQNLELAWEKVQTNRGSAGIDDVTIAQFEVRKEDYLELLHRKLRDGTSRPKPGKRVEIPKADGGVRTLGLPAVLDRVCQQALVQRMEGSVEPTVLDSSFGSRPGRSPHEAMRTGWQELNAGYGWVVEADVRQCFDTIDQAKLIDLSAEAMSDGRVLHLGREVRRAGAMEGGGWKPTWTGVPQGGVARPRWSNIFLTPFDRWMAAAGLRRTRWADAFVGRCQPRAEAQRALALAERVLRAELGVELHPQKTRIVHVSHGVAFLGYTVKRGRGFRLPAPTRRRRPKPQGLYAIPREKSVKGFQEQSRALTRRKAPLTRRAVIERINPVIRGWGHFYRKADVRRLFHRLEGWIEHRLDSFLATRWRNPMWRTYPTRRLMGALGLGRLTHLIPGLVPR